MYKMYESKNLSNISQLPDMDVRQNNIIISVWFWMVPMEFDSEGFQTGSLHLQAGITAFIPSDWI